MLKCWKKHFSLKKLSLDHDKPTTFFISEWQKDPRPSIIYMLYRWTIAIIFFVTIIFSIVDLNHASASSSFRVKWLIYLTNWGYSMCTLQALLAATILSICVFASHLEVRAVSFYKIYWLINIIATDIAFAITALYWSLIYDERTELDAVNLLTHANNSLLMVVDLFVVAHPVRILHYCYPVGFGVCYTVFSGIFYAAGGTSREGHSYIYDVLDWGKPGRTSVICIAVIGFVVIVHVFSWLLYKFRIRVHDKCFQDMVEGTSEG